MDMISTGSECTLVACPNPLNPADRMFARIPAGQTLAEMIGADASHSLAVKIDGNEIPRELWGKVRPKAGRTVHVTGYPQGGGNGSKWIRIIAMAVLTYFTAGYGATWATGLASSTGISTGVIYAAAFVVGNLAITPMIGQAREIAE
jgi:hypothetical protein